MSARWQPLVVALVMAAAPWSVMAEDLAAVAMPIASAPAATKPGPRQLTPQQSRDSATAPGDLRPEHAGVPQINIPLGRKRPALQAPPPVRDRYGAASAASGIGDAVARCEAEADAHVRAECRARLAREDRTR